MSEIAWRLYLAALAVLFLWVLLLGVWPDAAITPAPVPAPAPAALPL